MDIGHITERRRMCGLLVMSQITRISSFVGDAADLGAPSRVWGMPRLDMTLFHLVADQSLKTSAIKMGNSRAINVA